MMNNGVGQTKLFKSPLEIGARFLSIPNLNVGERFPIEEPFQFFRVDTGDDLTLSLDNSLLEIDIPAGVCINFSSLGIDLVRRATLINRGAGATAARVYYGTGNITDSRVTITGSLNLAAPATLRTVADVVLPAGVITQISAQDANKKETWITSNDAAANVRIGEAAVIGAARGDIIAPLGKAIITGSFAIFGFSVAGTTVAVMESAT